MFYAFIYFFGQRNPESCLNPYSLIDSLVDRGSYRCSNDKKPLFTGELCAIVQTNYNNTFFHGFMVRFLNFLKIFLGNIIFSFTPLVTFYYIYYAGNVGPSHSQVGSQSCSIDCIALVVYVGSQAPC